MSAIRRILLLAVLLLVPARARAISLTLFKSPLQLNITEYGTTAYHVDNGNIAPPTSIQYDPTGSGYFDWLNRLQVDGSWRDFTALIRMDSDLFFHAPQAAPGDTRIENLLRNRFGQRVDLEKVAVGYTSRHLELTLGDSYVTYGRGLVLALRKEDELGVETTLRGGSVTAHVAGLNANVVAGVSNIINVDTGTGREADDPDDLILGSRLEYRFGKWVVPGIDIAHIRYSQNFSTLPQSDRDNVTAYSATLELPYLWGYGNIYLEYAQQRPEVADTFLQPVPTAFYGAATAYVGRATLLLEFKNYRHYPPIATSIDPLAAPELALTDYYNAPPTLERVEQEVLDNSDVTGPHLRIDVSVTKSFAPYVSMAGFDDRVYQVRIYDPYAGFELRWQGGKSRADISGGYRVSTYDAGARDGQPFEHQLHAEYDINQWLTGRYSIELDGLHVTHFDWTSGPERTWHEGEAYLSFKKANAWSLAVGYEYYTEFPNTIRSNYVNGRASINIGKSVLVRLFVGGQRAGIKCVNGVCRNYPAFDGARAEVTAKF